MKNLLTKFAPVLIILTLFIGTVTTVAAQAATTFRIVQTPTLHLYTGVSAVATSMRITPYPRDLDGVKLTMTDFGSSTTLTLDPKVANVEEIIGFTGIVDNGDNTATLSGLSRDLQSKYPYTGTGTGRTHGAGATVVFGNNPQVYGRLAAKENDEVITGLWTATRTPVTALGLATKGYVDGIYFGGIGNASETATGTVEIATKSETAAGTTNGSLGRLAIPASAASSTFSNATVSASTVVVTGALGKIDDNYLSTSTLFAPITTDVQVFTGSGTWTKPMGGLWTEVYVIGAGGGGGSGGANQNGSDAGGGAGGAGGGFSYATFRTSNLAATITVTIGAGGAGGAGVLSATSPGNPGLNGTNGGTTSFGTLLNAWGGMGGLGAGTGGSAGAQTAWPGPTVTPGTINFNTASSSTATTTLANIQGAGGIGGASAVTPVAPRACFSYVPCGGGGGGGVGSNVGASGAVGAGLIGAMVRAGGTAGGGAGVAASTGDPSGGTGGGGGTGVNDGNGIAGGTGGFPGGGGGGGGGADNTGNTSGAGGTGGAGVVIVVTHR